MIKKPFVNIIVENHVSYIHSLPFMITELMDYPEAAVHVWLTGDKCLNTPPNEWLN